MSARKALIVKKEDTDMDEDLIMIARKQGGRRRPWGDSYSITTRPKICGKNICRAESAFVSGTWCNHYTIEDPGGRAFSSLWTP